MSKNPLAEFETSMGKFVVEIYLDKMPITAGNFVKLIKSGFCKILFLFVPTTCDCSVLLFA